MLEKAELFRMLQQKNFQQALLAMQKQEVTSLFGAAAGEMVGYKQNNPHHCYELWEHCVRAAAGVLHSRDAQRSGGYHNDRDMLLSVAALFHDIGKPLVVKEKEGRFVYYGHSYSSYCVMKEALPLMGFTKEECFRILFLIRHHDDFVSYTDDEDSSRATGRVYIDEYNVARYKKRLRKHYPWLDEGKYQELLEDLLRLCQADVKAQSPIVELAGTVVDSRKEKCARLTKIKKLLV